MSAVGAAAGGSAVAGDRTNVLRRLSRPATPADRRRARLVILAVAGCGMFALAAIAILALRGDGFGGTLSVTTDAKGNVILVEKPTPALQGLAPYLSQSGLRGGTAFGVALLIIPFVLFGIQALRTGTAARERRMAALSLAGATRPQLRRLAFLEGTRAAVIGALLAGPGYLVLWLVCGVLLPDGWKMLPSLTSVVPIAWAVLVIVLTALGGAAAWLAAQPATVSPLGMTRRQPRPLGPANAIVPVAAVLIVLAGFFLLVHGSGIGLVALPAVVVVAITVGPWLILLTGRWAAGRGLVTTMAGRRLLADVRSPGRVVGVLLAAGIAFGAIAAQVAWVLVETDDGYDLRFRLGGYAAATVGALLACVVASSSLVVAANEQVLDGRRSNAVLVALAASPRFIVQVVRRQLLLAAVPAAVLGAAFGWLIGGGLFLDGTEDHQAELALGFVLALPCGLIVSAFAAGLGAWLAARAVRPAIFASSSADNLRAP